MKKLKQFALNFGIPVVALVAPVVALAQGAVGSPPTVAPIVTGVTTLSGVGQTLCGITNWLFYFLIIIAVIFIIIAAFKYLTAAGDPEKVKAASHMLLYAAIAIVVGIIAKAVPSLIGSVLGGSGTATC